MNQRGLRVFVITVMMSVLFLPSCLKEGTTTILLNDPQEIPFITDYLPRDLLDLYGEEHIFFGNQPPVINMEFRSLHEYVATNLEPPFAPQPGQLSPIAHYHLFRNQYLQIADYLCMSSEETFCKIISPVYLTGRDSSFTAFFNEITHTEGTPVHAVLMSGTMTAQGVKDFRYGYKILSYQDSVAPGTVYPVNSIFIFKDFDGLAEQCSWFHDDLLTPQTP